LILSQARAYVTSRDMRMLEINSEYLGVLPLQLMENAGKAVADEIASRFKPGSQVVFFSGTGRNGGDGMVAARHLVADGFKVKFILFGRESDISDEIVVRNWKTLREMDWTVDLSVLSDSSLIQPLSASVLVDALLGTGAKGSLRQPVLQAVRALNDSEGFCVAVDVPSGVDADTGDLLGEAVKADLTVTLHRMKSGLEKAREHCGEIKVVEIGIPYEAELYAGPGDVEIIPKTREPQSHKGDFGRLLIIGGSETFSGAPTLVALAALRTGVDLAYVAAPERTAYAISSFSPDLITIKLSGEHFASQNVGQLKGMIAKATAVVAGPGLGTHKDSFIAVEELLKVLEEFRKPTLLDADALKAFGAIRRKVGFPLVITPHSGEFETVAGRKPSTELRARVEDVKSLAKETGSVVLLKGHVDIVSDGERVKLNFTGNPGMTVGGTGDVLSGIVGGFMAQGVEKFEAAVAGAFINGAAGDFVYRDKGFHMTPTDLIEYIPRVIMNPMSHRDVKIHER